MALSDSHTGRRPFWRRSGPRPPANPEPPSLTQTTFPTCRAHYPGGPDQVLVGWRVARSRPGFFPVLRGFLPCSCCLRRYPGRPAFTSLISRPPQASHALRPAALLTHHTWALSRGFALTSFPAGGLASYQVEPATSLGGFFPHW